MTALDEEVVAYVERQVEARDAECRRLVVRNGQAPARGITCGAGTLEVRAPRVNDRRIDEEGAPCRFASRIVSRYPRPSPKVAEVAFKLLMPPQVRWRKLNGSHLLPLVPAAVPIVDGLQVERREDEVNRKEAASLCFSDPTALDNFPGRHIPKGSYVRQ